MALANPLESFIWGSGGARKTPEEIARDREIAAALMAQGVDTSPVGHWTQGAARVVSALGGVLKERRAGKASETNASESQSRIAKLLGGLGGGTDPTTQFPPAPGAQAAPMDYASQRVSQAAGDGDIRSGIIATAQSLGIDPVDLATAISYETAGTFDPRKKGPTTQWGQHEGLIQFGEPQAQKYGVDWNNPIGSQLGPDGAVAKYLKDTGVQPGMGLMDIYSAINAGGVGRYGASDANNGGAPGTVADKVNQQMAGHREKAMALLGAQASPQTPVPFPGATPMPEMAGNAPQPVQTAQAGGLNPAIIEALSSPYASAQERSIAGILLEQEMKRQAQANDPNAGLDAEYKRAQIANMQSQIDERQNPSVRDQFGLSPIYGKDADGNLVVMQPSKGGGLVKADLPEGVTLQPGVEKVDLGTHWGIMDRSGQITQMLPKDVAGEAAASAGGKAVGEAGAALPQVEAGFQSAVEQIDQLMNHPGLDASVGTIQGQIPDSVAGAMNSDVADFRARLQQAKGQTFLRAFEALKGGGAITEIEGLKAEQAIGRLNQAVSEKDFKQALTDLKVILERGVTAYRQKAGQTGNAAPAQQRRLKFNPATGELE